MDPKAIIEGYVSTVVRQLPRRQRNDVGFELRSLLLEDLDGRAADNGRPADAPLAMELVTAFGRPSEVADRYRPAGFTVIRPADAPRFAWVALGGVLIQWAITLPVALFGPAPVEDWAYGAGTWWGRLSVWWLSGGLGAFWWPGVLISFTLIAGAVGRPRGEVKAWTPPRAVDRDQVNRPGLVMALGFWVVGASALIAMPWLAVWAPGLPQPVLDAFALESEFLRWRAPWVLPLWAAHFGLYGAVLLAGRWSRVTRRVHLGLNLAWFVLLIWWLAAGPIFQAEGADGVAKLSLLGIVLIVVVDLIATLRRSAAVLRPPAIG